MSLWLPGPRPPWTSPPARPREWRVPSRAPNTPQWAAISLVDVATSSGADASAEGTLPAYLPGDFFIAWATSNSAEAYEGPAGWDLRQVAGGSNTRGEIWTRFAVASTPAPVWNVAFTNWNVIIAAYRGVDATTPVAAVDAGTEPFSSSSSGVELTLGAGSYQLVGGYSILGGSSSVNSDPAGMSNRTPGTQVQNGHTSALFDRVVNPAGSTTYSENITWTTTQFNVGALVALNPAAALAAALPPSSRRRLWAGLIIR